MSFLSKLSTQVKLKQTLLCVGLDVDKPRIPEFLLKEPDPLLKFNQEIIEATKDFAVAYKPNKAFYAQYGSEGYELLEKTLALIPSDIPIIMDVKRSDIGNTAEAYARSVFEHYNADAVTLNPYMGFDSLEPFLKYKDKMNFVLCLTSNPGSADFQKIKLSNHRPLFEHVAEKLVEWNKDSGNIGLVVGATNNEEMLKIREIARTETILVPGIGAQGGEVTVVMKALYRGDTSLILNSSRNILYADHTENFAKAARDEAEKIKKSITLV